MVENIQVALKTSPYQAAEVGIETRGFMKPDDDIFVNQQRTNYENSGR